MRSVLHTLTWRKLNLQLRNTRNTFARQHPLFVFKAILLYAAGLPGKKVDAEFFFHLHKQPPGNRMKQNRVYDLEIIFPTASSDDIQRFSENVSSHLTNPKWNFTVEKVSPPQVRTLSDLMNETPLDQFAPEDLCLDFLTPFAFNPEDPRRRWMISRSTFFESLRSRIVNLFNVHIPSLEQLAPDLEIFPYYWNFNQFNHQSKSSTDSKGEQFITGMAGPLYLRGNWQELYPLLLLGSELQIGRSVRSGQGHYVLLPQRSFFDRALTNPDRYHEVFSEILEKNDVPDEFTNALVNKEEVVDQLIQEFRSQFLDFDFPTIRDAVCLGRQHGNFSNRYFVAVFQFLQLTN